MEIYQPAYLFNADGGLATRPVNRPEPCGEQHAIWGAVHHRDVR